MAKPSIWRDLGNAAFALCVMMLAAIAILSGALSKTPKKEKAGRDAEVGVTVRVPAPAPATPAVIPDAKRYPI